MSIKITTKEYIERAKQVHKGENIDYSEVNYTKMKDKCTFIDHDINPDTGKEYGEFSVTAYDFLKGCVHPLKTKQRVRRQQIMSMDEFKRRAEEVHQGENLDYSKTIYKGIYEKICIIDHDINPRTGKEYGEYWQIPNNHLRGQGHPDKGNINRSLSNRSEQEDFIKKANEVHKDENLDFSKVKYIDMHTKVCIVDHDINPRTGEEYGEYWQAPMHVLKGQKHPLRSGKGVDREMFIELAQKAHQGENLDYSKVNYKNKRTKVCIIDHDINPETGKEYGEYWQTPQMHLKGQGHPVKGKQKQIKGLTFTEEEVILKMKKKFPQYDYSQVTYIPFP